MQDSKKETKFKYHVGYTFSPGLTPEDVEFQYLNDENLNGFDIYDHICSYVKADGRKINLITIFFN